MDYAACLFLVHGAALSLFGFDASTLTIYLSKSTAVALICLDDRICRTTMEFWYCNDDLDRFEVYGSSICPV